MKHNLHRTLQTLSTESGVSGQYYSLPALEAAGIGTDLAASRVHPDRAGKRAAQLRRQEGHRRARAAARELGADRAAHRGDPVHRRARRAAGLHRRAAAVRSRRDARRRAAAWARIRRSIEPLVPVDLVVDHSVQVDYYGTHERARPQHEDRVPAQRRALQVHEVGHAGVRHVQGRAARHRHRAPGQPRVPRARRASEGRHLLPRHAGRHRLAHDDDQRHRRRRAGASAASRPRPACWASRCTC